MRTSSSDQHNHTQVVPESQIVKKSAKKRAYYRVVSQFFGWGKPLHTKKQARSESKKLVDLAPDDDPWIDVVYLTETEYNLEMEED